eukprot:TRINITY_DN100447_c0_g1_i1.p1 TRINITY_DN100447_c0_g1~~TRINITY_DN100447_c0_g1_i1.p1  ORF type:complete len:347 (-),score=54.54 TRINITY_DN100447_c0_g1_i1:11-1051(-)
MGAPGRGRGSESLGRGRGVGGGTANASDNGNVSGWKRCKVCGKKGHTMSDCPQVSSCSHCGSEEHRTKKCTFGVRPSERFLLCKSSEPRCGCFWRRFLVPLSRGDAMTFDASKPSLGRADVGLRCLGSSLFRSQGLRRNAQAILSFEASGHTLEASGALVRNLRPDEAHVGLRLQKALGVLKEDGERPPDPETDPEGWSSSEFRGLDAYERTTLQALKSALKSNDDEGSAPTRTILLLLSENGTPVTKAMKQIAEDERPVKGIVSLVGDDRGLSAEEFERFSKTAEKCGAEVIEVSLGQTTLLASHAIVILQHYLDEKLHRCEVPKPREYAKAAASVDQRAKRRKY